MSTYITDPTLVAVFNAGLPPDEQESGYWQLDQHEMEVQARQDRHRASTMAYIAYRQEDARKRREMGWPARITT